MTLKKLEGYSNDMLTIDEEEEELQLKYVFQTRQTKETVGEIIRSPMGLFSRNEAFVDNDAQMILDHLNHYYEL